MTAELIASRHNATLILTFSNPAARNSLHPDMYAGAIEALSTAERDDSIRTVVVTGDDHVFCSGSNLHLLTDNITRSANREQSEAIDNLHGLIDALRACPKPVIAAVDGIAADAGFSLALSCDLIVAGNSAQFMMTYPKMGLTPDGGGIWFLMQALSRQLASEILLTGNPVRAQRLFDMGIINKLVPDGTALLSALQWADELAAHAPHASAQIKSLIQDAQSQTLHEHFLAEKDSRIAALNHPDALEGIRAFIDKRKASYQ